MTSSSRSTATTISPTLALSLMATGAGLMWLWQEGRRQYKYRIPSHLLNADKNPFTQELQLAVKLALKCGNNMKLHYDTKGTTKESQSLDISTKNEGGEDFCTAVDLQNEKLVMTAIRKTFPMHDIIGEEEASSAGSIPPLNPNKPTWIIDPIDGTTNFASALPLTCVSIGYCVNGKPVMGVVYAPFTEELYLAVDGQGAYRNGERLVVGGGSGSSDNNNKTSTSLLSQSVVNAEFGYARSEESINKMTQGMTNILKTTGCLALRMMGSGVLDLCYVASGRLGVVYSGVADEGWKPWDYCAGVCIVTEAGAKVEALKGTTTGVPFDLYSDSIVCATSQELLEETRRVVLGGVSEE